MGTDGAEQPLTVRYYPPRDRWRLGLLKSALLPCYQLFEDNEIMVIADTSPKSVYHFLALPRKTIDTVSDLRTGDIPLLESMIRKSQEFADREIRPHTRFPVILGFHVIPTFIRLHLHIISMDFQGPGNQGYEDYKSFTDDVLWMTPEKAIAILRERGCIEIDRDLAESRKHNRSVPLLCQWCPETFTSVSKLKNHILTHEAYFA